MSKDNFWIEAIIGFFTVIVGVIAFFVIWIPFAILDGFVLIKLWGWFIVPTFALPTLGLAAAIGIAMIIRYLTHEHKWDGEKNKKNLGSQFAIAISYPILSLLLGYIVSLFM